LRFFPIKIEFVILKVINLWHILSTHPSNASRIQDLKSYLPTAKMYAEKYNQPLSEIKK